MSLEDLRKHYKMAGLNRADLQLDPFKQFESWFREMSANNPVDWFETNAMTLSTAGRDGTVSSRTVLLKVYSSEGFVFFTNYESEKSKQMVENPNASLLMYWPFLERQIRMDGTVDKVSRELSEKYFHSRPRGSQIGAAVSPQSEPIVNRRFLEDALSVLETELEGRVVPLPENWGGFRLVPRRFEFWQGRENRLHDRFRYRRDQDGSWKIDRLGP